MTNQEFKKAVNAQVKVIMTSDAELVRGQIEHQHQYRNYGVGEMTLNELLKEIAICNLLGISFVDAYTDEGLNELIKEL